MFRLEHGARFLFYARIEQLPAEDAVVSVHCQDKFSGAGGGFKLRPKVQKRAGRDLLF